MNAVPGVLTKLCLYEGLGLCCEFVRARVSCRASSNRCGTTDSPTIQTEYRHVAVRHVIPPINHPLNANHQPSNTHSAALAFAGFYKICTPCATGTHAEADECMTKCPVGKTGTTKPARARPVARTLLMLRCMQIR